MKANLQWKSLIVMFSLLAIVRAISDCQGKLSNLLPGD